MDSFALEVIVAAIEGADMEPAYFDVDEETQEVVGKKFYKGYKFSFSKEDGLTIKESIQQTFSPEYLMVHGAKEAGARFEQMQNFEEKMDSLY